MERKQEEDTMQEKMSIMAIIKLLYEEEFISKKEQAEILHRLKEK